MLRVTVAGLMLLLALGCSSRGTPPGTDSGVPDAMNDSSVEDSGRADASDASPDASDAGVDAPADGALDAAVDADAAIDSAMDSGADDSGADASVVDSSTIDAGVGTCGTAAAPAEGPCPTSCGDDVRSTCTVCRPGPCGPRPPGGPPPPEECCEEVTEVCDGTDLGGATCSGLGFAGGTLECTGQCTVDEGTCTTCRSGASILGCDDAVVTGLAPSALALAATATDVALAWVSDGGSLRFARFDSMLRRVTETECFGPSDARRVALAETTSGWLLAVGSSAGLDIYALDRDGAVRGTSRRVVGGHSPLMAGRSGSTPLLVWTAGGNVRAALLDDGGDELWRTDLASSPTEPHLGSAVAVGDGFLVAMRVAGVQVYRLRASDGRVTSTSTPGGSATEYPKLASDGTTARISWSDFGGSGRALWAPLDADGARTATATELGAIPDYFNPSPMVAIGADTLVLLGGYTGTTAHAGQLDLRRLRATGATIGTGYTLDEDPNMATDYRIARRGPEAVVAWVGVGYPGRIGLARLML